MSDADTIAEVEDEEARTARGASFVADVEPSLLSRTVMVFGNEDGVRANGETSFKFNQYSCGKQQ